jgi:hypothetical protein
LVLIELLPRVEFSEHIVHQHLRFHLRPWNHTGVVVLSSAPVTLDGLTSTAPEWASSTARWYWLWKRQSHTPQHR